jgi:hypothetical protein
LWIEIHANLLGVIPCKLVLCYTGNVEANQHIWHIWANNLHRWGVKDWVASFLEAAGPLTVLCAQAVYIGQPLLNNTFPAGHLDALAQLLEEPRQAQAFVSFLREGSSP